MIDRDRLLGHIKSCVESTFERNPITNFTEEEFRQKVEKYFTDFDILYYFDGFCVTPAGLEFHYEVPLEVCLSRREVGILELTIGFHMSGKVSWKLIAAKEPTVLVCGELQMRLITEDVQTDEVKQVYVSFIDLLSR